MVHIFKFKSLLQLKHTVKYLQSVVIQHMDGLTDFIQKPIMLY